MKKAILTLLGAAAAMPALAQSSVTIFGVLDVVATVRQTGSGFAVPGGPAAGAPNARVVAMDTGVGTGSRLGFTGLEDLGGGLKATFMLEMGIAPDSGTLTQGGIAFGRQSFVGLTSQNWSVTLGRHYTPMSIALTQSEALASGYWGTMVGEAIGTYESLGAAPGSGAYQFNQRADNSVFVTANQGPITGRLLVGAGNENTRGTGRTVQGSLSYNAGPLRVNAAYSRVRQNVEQIVATATPEWLSQWMVGGTYDFKVAKIYSGYFNFVSPKNKANWSPLATFGAPGANIQAYTWDKNHMFWLGTRVPVDNNLIIFQVGRDIFKYNGAPDGKSTIIALAFEHSLSKRTLLYTSIGKVVNNGSARAPLLAAIPAVIPTGFGADPSAFSVGVRHTF